MENIDTEIIIKSKKRVQKHGEVLTPKNIVKKMLDTPDIKELSKDLETTFLEPGAGEGAFLTEILRRKLTTVTKFFNSSILQYENYSLFALTTIYGIELLEDNTSICIINLFEIFYDFYIEALKKHDKKIKRKVLDSAKIIITANIIQGDFLTRKNNRGEDLIFSHWKPTGDIKGLKTISVSRTEYTMEEIIDRKEKKPGEYLKNSGTYDNSILRKNQVSFFQDEEEIVNKTRYQESKITDVCLELMEDEDEDN